MAKVGNQDEIELQRWGKEEIGRDDGTRKRIEHGAGLWRWGDEQTDKYAERKRESRKELKKLTHHTIQPLRSSVLPLRRFQTMHF